jgi:hypothetical protein
MSPMLTASAPSGGETGSQRPSAGEQLQPRFLGAEQQGDGVDVLVRGRADAAFGLARDRRVMQQPHDRVAVLHGRVEPVLGQAEWQRDRAEDAQAALVELAVERLERVAEALDSSARRSAA